jgi:hypothetical protein
MSKFTLSLLPTLLLCVAVYSDPEKDLESIVRHTTANPLSALMQPKAQPPKGGVSKHRDRTVLQKDAYTRWIVDGRCSYKVDGKTCGVKVDKKSAKRHFERTHPEYEPAEAAGPDQSQILFPPIPHANTNTRLLALYYATSNAPLRTIDNHYLRRLLLRIPNLPTIPSRRTLLAQMDKELRELMSGIVSRIKSASHFSIGCDIVTTKNMRAAYLGITAHFYEPRSGKNTAVALDLLQMDERHTGEYILEKAKEALQNMGLEWDRVERIVTDGGSNMRKFAR